MNRAGPRSPYPPLEDPPEAATDHRGASRFATDHRGASRFATDHRGASRFATDHRGASRFATDPGAGPRFTRSPLLDAIGVRHGFTTRLGGVSPGRHASLNLGSSWGDDPAHVAENLRRLAAAAGFAVDSLCQVVQVHGTAVAEMHAAERRQREADGMATTHALTLGVLSADCVGLLLADGDGRVAAAHAGWRGTVADMAGAVVGALVKLGARAADIRVALGPSIGPCCFEVQEDVAAAFHERLPAAVQRRDGRLFVDLWATHQALLCRAGVLPEHIDAAPPCTRCDAETYFSYRRDGAGIGQQLAFISGGKA